ncbi:hypothetical protein F4778DRAFT_551815 [Xylariomycetidae sp. FL2044]|nr:hypothetical protein F4778DRAFT_551815 [Xylariomycetidae sp. FL2044]
MAHLELFVLSWGIYARRVLIYLREKGLIDSPHIKITEVTMSPTGKMEAPGKPAGTVPMLMLPNGHVLRQSLAIIEYFEDLCDHPAEPWQRDLAASAGPGMRGATLEERAHYKEMVGLADEMSAQFVMAAHKGSSFFAAREATSPVTARLLLENVRKNMGALETYYAGDDAAGFGRPSDRGPIIADCILVPLLEYSVELFGVDLLAGPELPNLRGFYEAFKERESARIGDGFYPAGFKELGSVWLE